MALASAAGAAQSGGRLIPAVNLHVTLAFLGNVEAARLPRLREVSREAADIGSGPLRLRFETLEYWPRPRILCSGAEPATSAPAFALADRLKQATLAAGFGPDLKPFRAHVTVARKVEHASERQAMRRVSWNCDSCALLASTTGAEGSVYSVVESYPLDRSEKARE